MILTDEADEEPGAVELSAQDERVEGDSEEDVVAAAG